VLLRAQNRKTMAIIGRFEQGGAARWGLVEGEEVRWLDDPFASLEPGRESAGLGDLKILPPARPSKLFAIGLNYRAHAAEFNRALPDEPLMWFKAPTSLVAHGEAVEIAYGEHRTDFEAELAVVIGRGGRGIRESHALDHVLGYTNAQDISDRNIQRSESQWARAKSLDTYTPLGPFLHTGLDPQNLRIQTLVNGEPKQDAHTRDMIFPIAHLIAFVSRDITLEAGDVILSGTPENVGPLSPGDTLETRIGDMKPLINAVRLRER
jgi:2-keto-4-pentenoate hydratase/2-oxohepta-3-ene-1,7-dioic acid hydratase in catechol pathway